MDDMDDGLGDEVTLADATEGSHPQNKENEYSLKPESCSKFESQEMAIPKINSPDSSFQILADMLEGKNINGIVSSVEASEHPCTSLQDMDDAGVMVEELTVQKYNTSNLAIVGTSNNRERKKTRQYLHQLAGGSGSGSSGGDKEKGQTILSGWEDMGDTSIHGFLAQKPLNDDHNVVMERFTNSENNGVSSNMLSHGHMRTKILSKSGFSEFFVKTTLKGKGMVRQGPPHDAFKQPRDLKNREAEFGTTMHSNDSLMAAGPIAEDSNVLPKIVDGTMVTSNASLSLGAKVSVPSSSRLGGARPGSSDHGVSLREWLKARGRKVKKVECLHIFRQIVDLVDYSHAQAITLLDLRPSSFKLLQSNQVKYLGANSQKETLQSVTDQDVPNSKNYPHRRRPAEEDVSPPAVISGKKQKFNIGFIKSWPSFSSTSGIKVETTNESDLNSTSIQHSSNDVKCSSTLVSDAVQQHLTSVKKQLEEKWYASPEELNEGVCSISSNIYSLGVLFFELLGQFDSEMAHAVAMSDLRHRILPPTFLSENPKEAGFCLWLLHPEPLSRPTTREILQSAVINGLQELCAEDLSLSIDQDDSESELLFHFLISLEEQKKSHASKLQEDSRCLEADISEVYRRLCLKNPLVQSCLQKNSINASENKHLITQPSGSEVHLSPVLDANEMSLMRNLSQLERAYFSMRSKIQLPDTDATTRQDKDLLKQRGCQYLAQKEGVQNPTDALGSFFDGLCKFARHSKFEVRGTLRTGDLNNSANVICSLSFDRDEDYFAAAGVSKKIKVFEFNALFNDAVDIHYPALEMSNRSRLSCICWNNYIKNFLASADHDGVVKIWDVSTGQTVSHFTEHVKRAWSVDFSRVHPTKFASGSDDYSVKLWSINEKNCLATIRNAANVCCVQFSTHSTHLLAFSSADYRTYCFDIRNTKAPWCVLAGHEKAVSYVKFLDSGTLVTASTDNTLKLWDLTKTSHCGLSTNSCILTFSGHTNEKNFVGLSTADGHIACGSETNEVYAYYRSLPMPIASYKFGSIDPISGKETDDDNGLFVSSVCWRAKSDMVVAANSSFETGSMRVLSWQEASPDALGYRKAIERLMRLKQPDGNQGISASSIKYVDRKQDYGLDM